MYEFAGNNSLSFAVSYGLDTAWTVGKDWFYETNKNGRIYGPENEITVELMKDEGVAWARGEWKKRGCPTGKNMNYHFGAKEYLRELWERDATGSFLGSYAVRFYPQPCGKVRVYNR